MTEPASPTLADLRRLDEKLDRFHGEVGERFDRIGEQVVVTDTGCELITHFPAEDLPIANAS